MVQFNPSTRLPTSAELPCSDEELLAQYRNLFGELPEQ